MHKLKRRKIRSSTRKLAMWIMCAIQYSLNLSIYCICKLLLPLPPLSFSHSLAPSLYREETQEKKTVPLFSFLWSLHARTIYLWLPEKFTNLRLWLANYTFLPQLYFVWRDFFCFACRPCWFLVGWVAFYEMAIPYNVNSQSKSYTHFRSPIDVR